MSESCNHAKTMRKRGQVNSKAARCPKRAMLLKRIQSFTGCDQAIIFNFFDLIYVNDRIYCKNKLIENCMMKNVDPKQTRSSLKFKPIKLALIICLTITSCENLKLHCIFNGITAE